MAIDERKLEVMEWAREKELSTTEQMELGQFQVGFPEDMDIQEIYISYVMAKYGPPQTMIEDQEQR